MGFHHLPDISIDNLSNISMRDSSNGRVYFNMFAYCNVLPEGVVLGTVAQQLENWVGVRGYTLPPNENLQNHAQINSANHQQLDLTLPLVGASSAVMIFIVVVFPAPLWPSRPNTSPASTANDRDLTATFIFSSGSSASLKQQEQYWLPLASRFLYSLCKSWKTRVLKPAGFFRALFLPVPSQPDGLRY